MNAISTPVPRAPRLSLAALVDGALGRAPGLVLVGLLVAIAFAIHGVVPVASPVLIAMGLGIVAAPAARARPATEAGVRFSVKTLLRTGVALLGLSVSLGELAAVGWEGVVLAGVTICVTLGVAVRLGRLLGVPPKLALLIGTGSAICGASAIAAMDAVTRARGEDVGYAVATVTVFGSVAMLLVPVVAPAVGLGPEQAGLWAGASIHEVAQVAGAGAAISAAALKTATLVKLTRVVLLAPAVAVVGAMNRTPGVRTPRVPGFVLAFLALVVLRSLVPLPEGVLHVAAAAATGLLACALAALGLGVHVAALRVAGPRPLILGLAAWLTAAATAFVLVVALT